jgi:hypothetical protein
MDTREHARLAVKLSADRRKLDGAWWPRSRALCVELPILFEGWPVDAGHMSRVIYSPGDWDDRPGAVTVPRRHGRLKTGMLPGGETHQLVLVMLDGRRRSLVVIPPGAAEATAARYLRAFAP